MEIKNIQMRRLDSIFLREHFDEFYSLFAENTRGHEQVKDISEEYIQTKANEIFNYIDTDTSIILGSVCNNELIGVLWSYKRVFLEEKRIYINTLIINKDYRGLGVAKELMCEIEKIALECGIDTVDVSTATFKTGAINFYENLGYTSERIQFKKDLKYKS